MKQASLPNGKILQFDETMSDKDIQRAVRRELGLADKNILDGLDALAEHLEKIANQMEARVEAATKKQQDILTPVLSQINRALKDIASNGTMHNAQVLNSLHEVNKTIDKFDKNSLPSIEKATRPMVKVFEDLASVIGGLKADIKEAISYSHDITDANLKASMKAVASFNKTVDEIKELTQQIGQVLRDLRSSHQVTKRAFRNADGSWTLETRTH